ncbi:hypothetical protein CTI12_AA165660 [Artemisia annua]|uniref:Zinc knuckle CX2CX4HX4C n=1 Tax=Artemisia annua TaxID=35608 RepID=A0A2U1PDJ4_ARTAN|nr:hypothetical protein CTI12_AA165660 [Artemisia annua]
MDDGDDEVEEMKVGEESSEVVEEADEGLLSNKPKVSDVGNQEQTNNGIHEQNKVSVMFREVEVSNSANISVGNMNNKNGTKLNEANGVSLDIPIPVCDNPLLNPKQDSKMQSNYVEGCGNKDCSVLLGNVNGSGGMVNGVQGGNYSEYVVGESSKSKDVEMQDSTSSKRPMSFSNVVKGPYGSVNSRLRIGTPIIMDRITTAMCERSNGRANFARVLVEVDATKGIVDSVEVCYRGLGRSMHLKVEYAWRPPICSHCQVFGHSFKDCKNREATVEEVLDVQNAKNHNVGGANQVGTSNDGWKTVQAKKVSNTDHDNMNLQQENVNNRSGWSYFRGGPSYRGRGGTYARGGYNNARNYNENRNATSSSKPNGSVPKNDEPASVDKNSGKVNVKDRNGTKTLHKDVLKTNNSFGVLESEHETDVSNDWQNMKTKIDVACELGLEIPDDEKNKWSRDLQDYFVSKCKDLAKCKIRNQLMDRIKSLKKEMVDSIEAVVAKRTEPLVTEEMECSGASRSQAFSNVSIDLLYSKIVETVRLKLMSLSMKQSVEVRNAAKIWNLPFGLDETYGQNLANPSPL